MKKALVLARKDIASYFHSWLGVLVYVFFVMMSAAFFFLLLNSYQRLSADVANGAVQDAARMSLTQFVFGSFFMNLGLALTVLVPILSMRAFSEEHKYQTLEFLFTAPLSDFDIVAGKFGGLLWFFILLILPSMAAIGFLRGAGVELDWGVLAAGYLGLFLMGAACLAMGLFISALTDNPVVTAMLTFGALILLNGLDWLGASLEGPAAHVANFFSPLAHYRDFTFGIIDLSHFVFFLLFCLYFLFLTLRLVETRNWKG